MAKEFLTSSDRTGGFARKLGVWALGLAVAGGATFFVHHEMEKPAPAEKTELSTSQQAFLDKTAAATAERVLKDPFALTKQVTTAHGVTSIDVEQLMPKDGGKAMRPAYLNFMFQGESKSTDEASVERFLKDTHPHVESISIQKEGIFTLDVEGYDSGHPTSVVQMPAAVLQPHSGAIDLATLTSFDRDLAVANGMNGAEAVGGLIPTTTHNLLPDDIPPALDPHE